MFFPNHLEIWIIEKYVLYLGFLKMVTADLCMFFNKCKQSWQKLRQMHFCKTTKDFPIFSTFLESLVLKAKVERNTFFQKYELAQTKTYMYVIAKIYL